MLICPQCQFENPTANNFCQQCGVSLTHNTCTECGTLVPFDQLKCHECGAIAGVVWWAVIAPKVLDSDTWQGETKPSKRSGDYLDLHRRYQVIHPFSLTNPSSEQQGQVLDCQPFHLSVLESLIIKTFHDTDNAPTDFANLTTRNRWVDAMDALGIPAIAYPYISLNNQYYNVLPTIHNAWQSDQYTLLLLEDRSDYPLITQTWQDEQTEIPVLQLMQWLYDMVELWQAMAPWNCQQSLLILKNLRVDATDHNLCLQRLYFNPPELVPSLQDLGRIWQVICAGLDKTATVAISQLLMDMEEQTLTTPEAVQTRIEAIAQQYQAAASDTAPAIDPLDELKTAPLDDLSLSSRKDPAPVPVAAPDSDDEDDDEDDTQLDNLDSEDMPTIVLPMQLFSLEEVGRTDVGRQRDHNEDYFGIETHVVKLESPSGKTIHARNLYILCDGMGGHAGGEVASALAVDTIRSFFKAKWQNSSFPANGRPEFPDVATMTEAVLRANQVIYDLNQENARSGCGRMGTTLVMVLVCDTEVAVAHVGDSRLYRYTRKRGLEQITVDHEVGQREIQRGVAADVAYARPDAYQLTQALGPRDEHFVRPDVQFFELAEDMLLLLCSDGLTDNDLLEKHWESHVQPLLSSQTNLDKGVSELIDLANHYNGHDNVTAIAIRAKVRPCLEHLR